jgi:ABC-type phosphate/phosphonate transport system permease subunit
MEALGEILWHSVNGGFWRYIGYLLIALIIVATPLQFLLNIISTMLRHRNIRKLGYL